MHIEKNIAFIGAGNMAGALIRGLTSGAVASPGRIMAADASAEQLKSVGEKYGIGMSLDNQEAAQWAEVLVLSTKPQVLPAVLKEIAPVLGRDVLVVSIAAGVPLAGIENCLPKGTRVIRTMPNMPALVHRGATAVALGSAATDEDCSLARRMFDSVGITLVVEEKLLDAVTGLSGSGPAYVFLFLEALADGGVKMGLDRASAERLAVETVLGSAKLLLETGERPEELRKKVTSPGGTTLEGLAALEAGGMRATVVQAVVSATERARVLGAEALKKLTPPGS